MATRSNTHRAYSRRSFPPLFALFVQKPPPKPTSHTTLRLSLLQTRRGEPKWRVFSEFWKFTENWGNIIRLLFFTDVIRNKRIFWRLQKNLEVSCTLLIIIIFLVLHVQLSFIWIYRVTPEMNIANSYSDLVMLNINVILLLPLLPK